MKRSKVFNVCKTAFTAMCAWYALLPRRAYALQETTLYTGTMNLLHDGLIVLLAVEAALVVFLLVKELMAMQASAEEDKPKHKKNIKTILVVGVLAICASSILTAVFGYFRATE